MALTPDEQRELDELELAELEEQESGETPKAPNAFIRGAQNAATLGYAPQIAGATQVVTDKALQGLGKIGIGPYGKVQGAELPSAKDVYLQSRDQRLQEDKAAREANPGGSVLGTVAGSLATAPMMALKAAQGAGAAAKLGTLAASGALQGAAYNPGDTEGVVDPVQVGPRATNAMIGGAAGGLVGAAGHGVSKAMDGLKTVARKAARMNPGQAQAYVSDPKAVGKMAQMLDDDQTYLIEDQARQKLEQARSNLKDLGRSKNAELEALFGTKTARIKPSEVQGLAPELDEAIKARSNMYGQAPLEADVPLTALNAAKRSAQQQANFKRGTLTDPVQEARAADMAAKAAQLRETIEQAAGSDAVKGLNREMQESILLQDALRQAQKTNPLAFLSSEAPGRVAALSRAEAKGAEGLLDFGNKLGAARTMAVKDTDDALTRMAIKTGGRAALRGLDLTGKLASKVPTEEALIKAILEGQRVK